jgi:hypothetical protein
VPRARLLGDVKTELVQPLAESSAHNDAHGACPARQPNPCKSGLRPFCTLAHDSAVAVAAGRDEVVQ